MEESTPAGASGRFRTRYAETGEDVEACQRLRYLAFRAGRGLGGDGDGLDRDAFDPLCRHVMIEEADSGRLVCCFRLLSIESGAETE